jgi:hypothetical protein
MRSQSEELLRQRSYKWHVVKIVVIMCTCVFFLVHAVVSFNQTKSDRIMAWILAAATFLISAAFVCQNLYMRRKLKRILAEMHSASDLESAGELRTGT